MRVEVESFTHMDEAVATLQDPATQFDVFFPTIDACPGLIDAGLLRPLDHDQLPNVRNLGHGSVKATGLSTTRASATRCRTRCT